MGLSAPYSASRRVSAPFPPRRRDQIAAGTNRRGRHVAGDRNSKLTVFLDRGLTATWLLIDQRNCSKLKERRMRGIAAIARNPAIIALFAALAIAGCASKKAPNSAADLGLGGPGAPGSAQEFSVSVGDRIFFDVDSSVVRADARLPGRPRRCFQPAAHHFLWQGTPGRGLRRHLLLDAEPPRGDRAQRRGKLGHTDFGGSGGRSAAVSICGRC
jgi:hypothetical protein